MDNLSLISHEFHFLRPLWLCGLIPVALMLILLWRQKYHAQQWQQMIAPELLHYLLDGQSTRIKPWHWFGLLAAWLITCIALAGPTWAKRPMPVEQNQQALVILLDLSPSMLSEDIKPSRLNRARLKIADILRTRQDGQTALVAYAGEAHVVTPLTDDVETINNIVPALHPNVMPLPGSNTEAAVSRALQLLADSGLQHGDLLLITDGIAPEAQTTIRRQLQQAVTYRLSILGVGGSTPAPIPSGKGGFMRDSQRNLVTTQLDASELKQLAEQAQGRYATLANNNKDIDHLMALPAQAQKETTRIEREFDHWYDQGHWLVFLLLPFILYSFRRGLLVILFCTLCTPLLPQKSYAFTWDDLWKNKNQQAHEQFEKNNHEAAADQFTDHNWQGSANYRAGNYAAAAKQFAQSDTADAHYNRGNALAKQGELQEAIKAYNEALVRNPELTDAKENRERAQAALKQQQNEQQQTSQNSDQDQQNQTDNQQQDQSSEQASEQQSEQKSEQQQSGQQSEQEQANQTQSPETQPGDQQQQADNQHTDSQHADNQPKNQPEPGQQDSQEPRANENEQPMNPQQASEEQKKDDETEPSTEHAKQEDAKQGTPNHDEPTEQAEARAMQPQDDGMTTEERQAMEQWLRRIPDDPGGLLRNKFKYQYYQNRQDMRSGDFEPPENDANNRW